MLWYLQNTIKNFNFIISSAIWMKIGMSIEVNLSTSNPFRSCEMVQWFSRYSILYSILCLGITEFISKLEILNIYIFSVLDPHIKTTYFKSQWTPEKYAAAMRVVWKVVSRFYFIFQLELILFKFDNYYSHQTKITETLASGRQPELKHRNYLLFNYFPMQSGYGSAWMQDAICQAYNGPNKESGPDTEFNAYINSLPQ